MSTDLTTITTPFGLLDDEAQAQAQLRAAKDAGLLIEFYGSDGWINTSYISGPWMTHRVAPGQVWPKPEPRREVRYAYLLSDGTTITGSGCGSVWSDKPIIARARVELVEGQFDE